MARQLTIFDVEPDILEFDKEKAHWKQLLNTGTRYADVMVKIPRQAKLPTELRQTTAYDWRYELFEEYTYGLWVYERSKNKHFSWEAAAQAFQQARDNKEEVAIRVYMQPDGRISMNPKQVVRYIR